MQELEVQNNEHDKHIANEFKNQNPKNAQFTISQPGGRGGNQDVLAVPPSSFVGNKSLLNPGDMD